MSDERRECCKQEDNLGPVEVPKADRPELTVRTCKVCGAKSYLLSIDPGSVGLDGIQL